MGLALAFGLLSGAQTALFPTFPWTLLLLLTGALALVATCSRGATRLVIALGILGMLTGAAIASTHGLHAPPTPPDLPNMISAQITSDPDVTANGYLATAEWEDELGDRRSVWLYLPAAPVPSRGMRVESYGRFRDASAGAFYAEAMRITARPGWLEQRRQQIRQVIERTLVRNVGGAESALALGLLTGDDSALRRERAETLRVSGLSHLTAVSGWNVALVATAAAALLAPLPLDRRFVWLLQSLVIALFVWIVGGDPPVLRAGIMAQSALLARWYGRPTHSITALALAAAVMVVQDPEIVAGVSFRLSVAATVAMIVAADLTRRMPDWPLASLREAALTSGLAGIATAPILAGSIGWLALWTVPANVVVAPLIPPATITAALTCALAQVPLVGLPLATILGALTALLCAGVLSAADLIADFPGARLQTTWLSEAFLAALTTALLLATFAWMPEGRWLRRAGHQQFAANAPGTLVATVSAGVTLLAGVTLVLLV